MSISPGTTPRASLAGYRTLIVGAASGMGRAVVDLLGAEGARIVVCDLPSVTWHGPAEDVVRRLPIDVGDQATVTEAVAHGVELLGGGLDAVVNCAGVLGQVSAGAEESYEQFERLLRVNLLGAFAVSRAVLPVMAQAGFGRLVHIASIAGKDGNPRMTGYSASKAGVIGMVKALGKEYAPTGVTVNAIAPGLVETPLVAAMEPRDRERQMSLVPMGRIGTVAEIAALVRYVISPEASFTTGFVYDASGGRAVY
ncbi:SDR family NAD(P)-dependent oxidoreductase [Streptomyces sp. NPDC096057]|uniref:SDR family NAD(P)-dependent oxidoreductase n=1 Tax=Streptomyces sp. NPDC096057 TaxID=3155543 RepID=UPI00332A635F